MFYNYKEKHKRDDVITEDINQDFENIYKDLYELYKNTDLNKKTLLRDMAICVLENQSLHSRIEDLKSKLNESCYIRTFYKPETETLTNIVPSSINTEYGLLTLPVQSRYSRIMSLNNKGIDNTVKVYLDGIHQGRYSTLLGGIDSSVEGRYKYYINNGIGSSIQIELSKSMNPLVNYLEIVPTPINNVNIIDLKYIDTIIKDFPLNINPFPSDNCIPTKIYFTPLEINIILFSLMSSSSPGPYGLSLFDVGNENYHPYSTHIETYNDANIGTSSKINFEVHGYNLDNCYFELFSTHPNSETPNKIYSSLSETITQNIEGFRGEHIIKNSIEEQLNNVVYLVCHLKIKDSSTPVIRKIKIYLS